MIIDYLLPFLPKLLIFITTLYTFEYNPQGIGHIQFTFFLKNQI